MSIGCSQEKFDQTIWKKKENNKADLIENPRYKMLSDLKLNYLKLGLTKKEVIELLGKPTYDGNIYVLPTGISIPDSLRKNNDIHKINKWYKKNSIPVSIISYPVGWSIIDPISLQIFLDENEKVYEYRVKEH